MNTEENKLLSISHKPLATRYSPVIGLEVHVELKTNSKMFCGCNNNWFGQTPNTHTCPVCLGLPGALPIPNKTAIDWCVKISLALNCEINLFSKFDRKHYFYPDLPKGYQISQYDLPFGKNGHMELSNGKEIGIHRVHMEEDTGKLMHSFQTQKSKLKIQNDEISLIDFNRSGVPLVEIVTEPDFDNATDVKEYLQKLQQIVRYLDVSDADMEKGMMRLEPNISLRKLKAQSAKAKTGKEELPKYKVEVKNINSFSFVEKAITYELKRQEEILEKGETPKQETRGWDENKNRTVSQRSKEEAMDYRYFPEPDIPPFRFTDEEIHIMRDSLPELPDEKTMRFSKEYQLPQQDIEILTRDRLFADFYEEAVNLGKEYKIEPKKIANVMINKKIDPAKAVPAEIIKAIVESQKIEQIDPKELEKILTTVIENNPKAEEDYKKGKLTVIMFLVGQAMRELKGRAKADEVKSRLEHLLS